MKDIITMLIIGVVGVICTIFWYKKIDSETTYIYGIYAIIVFIFCLFALKALE